MARIRSIKVDQFLDDGLTEVSLEAHFLLLGLPCLADSAGRLEDRPRKIHALIFPYRQAIKVEPLLSELVRSGHIQRYTVGSEAYIQILDWDRDQRPHKNEPESTIPPTPQRYTAVGHVAVPGIPESTQGIPEEKGAAGVWGVGSGVRDPDPSFLPSASASAAPEQAALPGVATPTSPAKPVKKAKEAKKPEPPTDPRHGLLVKALTDEGWPFDGGKDAANVKALLGLADQQEATKGELAGMEVLRRARIAWAQFPGYHSARTLAGLRSKWGEFATPEPPKGGAPPALDVRRGGVRAELMDHTKPQEPF